MAVDVLSCPSPFYIHMVGKAIPPTLVTPLLLSRLVTNGSGLRLSEQGISYKRAASELRDLLYEEQD